MAGLARAGRPWSAIGQVVKLPNSHSDEVCLELRSAYAPTECTHNFALEFVWKATTFDRCVPFFSFNRKRPGVRVSTTGPAACKTQ